MVRRHSIGTPVTLEGTGLHLGVHCRLTFRPAAGGERVVFRRTDLPGSPTIPAHVDHAVLSERHTQLGQGESAIHTVEHVLAAVAAHEIDDLVIDIDGPEPPILDGSAGPYFDALAAAGVVDRPGPVWFVELARPLSIGEGDAMYHALPAAALELAVTIEFPHPVIGRQACAFTITRETFGRELAYARTFGFVSEVEELRRKGLIKGGTIDNAIVLDDHQVVGTELRWPDEFVRHKAMDCLGDLALAGGRVRARVIAHRPSHRGTVALVREMTKRAAKEPGMLGIDEIMKILPHRYPFLLVDRILEIEDKKRIVGLKNVTINEPFFQGHFPGHAIMPGVLIIEAMAQVGGVLLLMRAVDDPDSKVVYFMSLDNVKFRRPVKPGDQLRFELEVQQIRGRICKMRGVAYVDGEVAAEADMAAMVRDR